VLLLSLLLLTGGIGRRVLLLRDVDAASCGVLCFGLAFILFLIVCALVFVIEVPLPCVGLLVVVHSEAFACEGREVNCKRRGLCS
jgi:hypothetical protein